MTKKTIRINKLQDKNIREKINTYNSDHRLFSGLIYNSDFYHHTYMSDIAGRIASDMRFDEQCRRAVENKRKYKERQKERKSKEGRK